MCGREGCGITSLLRQQAQKLVAEDVPKTYFHVYANMVVDFQSIACVRNVILITTSSGLQYEDTVVGTGVEAVAGKTVEVHYTGTLTNGTKFDSSHDRNKPFSFRLGAGQVIKGWDEGVAGMKIGGKRKLVIPANLAYGNRAVGGVIPANATLEFVVELLKVS